MGTRIYTPAQYQINKSEHGRSDCYISSGCYKLMGCTVLSVNIAMGFNGTASSVSVVLVEDVDNGDAFVQPRIPSIWGISLPRGGVGIPILFPDGSNLQPNSFIGDNIPFYFSGICTNWSASVVNPSGRTISITLVDPRELLSGVQCLLSGFALSQEVGAGRFVDVNNVIDVFGYYNFGMESNRNEYGMQWAKIQEVIESIRVTIHDIHFEFVFTGDAFTGVPTWYRIDDQIIDFISLCQKVCDDSGSDYICHARKASSNEMVCEIRGFRRAATNPLTKAEIANFVNARSSIVESVNLGKEYKTEPTSGIIIGGMKNSNYVALPTLYREDLHLNSGIEDYNFFPSDIKVRLFGGDAEISFDPLDGGPVTPLNSNFAIETGAIFPFWGFTPDDHAYPLVEPFLPLDHLFFDRNDQQYAKIRSRIPLCLISVKSFLVRVVEHLDVFLEGDGEGDERPFAYLEDYIVNLDIPSIEGYMRGLPLNTEVLRAALVSEFAFYDLYSLYYPDIAALLGLPKPDWEGMSKYVSNLALGVKADLSNVPIQSFMYKFDTPKVNASALPRDGEGKVSKSIWSSINDDVKNIGILTQFRTIIYEQVRQYALDHMGHKFIICLPKSAIMNRIWLNLPVPTRPEKPEIEYVVDDRGFWDNIPVEFDGLQDDTNSTFTESEQEQIRRKFMMEDGRFLAMVAMDWKPKGNINFNSNGINKAMFQDLPTSEFRPNKIASANPEYVFISCNVSQLVKRPDLALLDLPGQVYFDPTPQYSIFRQGNSGFLDDEFIATKAGIMKYFWFFLKKDDTFRALLKDIADRRGEVFRDYANKVFQSWARQLQYAKSQWFMYDMSTEIVMDLKGAIIPLTSTWVTYGPWFATYNQAKGMTRIEIDDTLVPWNFTRVTEVDPNQPQVDDGLTPLERLDNAGNDILDRSLCDVDYVDNATITVAGFPEIGLGDHLGYNSNVTSITVEFGIGSVKTTYNLATYGMRPGTFRKSEFDNVSRARIDARQKLPDTINNNIAYSVFAPNERNRFPY